MPQNGLDIDAILATLEKLTQHYDRKHALLEGWLEDLYGRVSREWERVNLEELIVALRLYHDGHCAGVNQAANTIYKLIERQGGDVSGWYA